MAKNVVLVVIQAAVVKRESDQQASALALTDYANHERWCPQVMIAIEKCFDLFHKALRSLPYETLISPCVQKDEMLTLTEEEN